MESLKLRFHTFRKFRRKKFSFRYKIDPWITPVRYTSHCCLAGGKLFYIFFCQKIQKNHTKCNCTCIQMRKKNFVFWIFKNFDIKMTFYWQWPILKWDKFDNFYTKIRNFYFNFLKKYIEVSLNNWFWIERKQVEVCV